MFQVKPFLSIFMKFPKANLWMTQISSWALTYELSISLGVLPCFCSWLWNNSKGELLISFLQILGIRLVENHLCGMIQGTHSSPQNTSISVWNSPIRDSHHVCANAFGRTSILGSLCCLLSKMQWLLRKPLRACAGEESNEGSTNAYSPCVAPESAGEPRGSWGKKTLILYGLISSVSSRPTHIY